MSELSKINFLLPVPVAILVLLLSTQELSLTCYGVLETINILAQQGGGHRAGGGKQEKLSIGTVA